MTPQDQIDLRAVLLNVIEQVPKLEADALLQAVGHVEKFIDRIIDREVTAALKPFIKLQITTDQKTNPHDN